MAGNVRMTLLARSKWQTTTLSTKDLRKILDYACWPEGKPENASSMEISESKTTTVYELIGALPATFHYRGCRLTSEMAGKLRCMIKDALKSAINCDGKLAELFALLEI
jgi:hypothetical protein